MNGDERFARGAPGVDAAFEDGERGEALMRELPACLFGAGTRLADERDGLRGPPRSAGFLKRAQGHVAGAVDMAGGKLWIFANVDKDSVHA